MNIPFATLYLSFALLALAGCGGGGNSQTPQNAAPVANAGLARTADAGTSVTFDGGASTDANNDSLTYAWTLTARPFGSQAAIQGQSAQKPTLSLDVAGIYSASLVVSDGKLSSSAATVTVTALVPVLRFVELPKRAECVVTRQVFVIDRHLVFRFDKNDVCTGGNTAALYESTPSTVLCERLGSGVIGCNDESYRSMITTAVQNVNSPDLGLGPSRIVERVSPST